MRNHACIRKEEAGQSRHDTRVWYGAESGWMNGMGWDSWDGCILMM